jgi:hypothetical protein
MSVPRKPNPKQTVLVEPLASPSPSVTEQPPPVPGNPSLASSEFMTRDRHRFLTSEMFLVQTRLHLTSLVENVRARKLMWIGIPNAPSGDCP